MTDIHKLKRVCLVAGDTRLSSIRDRRSGYSKAVKTKGLKSYISGPHRSFQDGISQIKEVFASIEPPFGVLATDYRMLWHSLAALAQLRLRIPQDVTVTSFDSVGEATVTGLIPTSAQLNAAELATEAMDMLLSRMADPTLPPRTIRLGFDITYGTTCGCLQDSAAPHNSLLFNRP